MSGPATRPRPVYARVLGLRHLNPGGLLCFLYFEGALALAILLSLAELVSWWSVAVLPASVAIMVKLNDAVAGAAARAGARAPVRSHERRRAARTGYRREAPPRTIPSYADSGTWPSADVDTVTFGMDERLADPPEPDASPQSEYRVSRQRLELAEAIDSPQQRSRQSASRRYT
jgi:hypothetical protein